MKTKLLTLLIFFSYILHGQIQHQGKPWGTIAKTKRTSIVSQSSIVLPPFVAPEFTTDTVTRHKSLTFAHAFEVNINPNNSGNWSTTPSGQDIWRVSITSKGAASLNVVFSQFEIPKNGKVFIYNKDMSHIIGAFTHENNKKRGLLPTLPVKGDFITVEYQAPGHSDETLKLCIGSINHDYLGIFEKVGDFGDAADCEKDISCYENDYLDISQRSVVKLIINGTELMSGTLINNTREDGTPYIITAAHGYREHSMDAASTLFIFNYKVPHCFTQIEGSREQSIAGGEMLCYSPNTDDNGLDFALIKLSTTPPAAYRPVYAGWSHSADAPSAVHCIHHPLGDVKKISFDDDTLSIASLTTDDAKYRSNGHWKVSTWEDGITEGGSSGAGIFNNENQFLGGLSGGAASCSYPRNDYFYRMDLAWEAETDGDSTLSQYLDSKQTGVEEIAYYIPEEISSIQQITHINSESEVSAVRGDSFGNIAGNNSLGITRFVEKFEATDSSYIYGFYFVPSDGTSSSVVDINIWSGEDKPSELIFSEALILKRWSNSFPASLAGTTGGYYIKTDWALTENFVQLPQKIGVKGNFFIGFSVDNTQQDSPFGLTLSNNNSQENAYFYDGNWHAYSTLGGYHKATSLWIEPIVSLSGSTAIIDNEASREIKIWPNPVVGNQELKINTKALSSIAIYSIDGKYQACTVQVINENSTSINTSSLETGTYILKVDTKSFIFIKR